MAQLPDREIALHQALVGVLYVAKEQGVDIDDLVEEIRTRLLGNEMLRIVEHPHVTNAITELEEARDSAVAMHA